MTREIDTKWVEPSWMMGLTQMLDLIESVNPQLYLFLSSHDVMWSHYLKDVEFSIPPSF